MRTVVGLLRDACGYVIISVLNGATLFLWRRNYISSAVGCPGNGCSDLAGFHVSSAPLSAHVSVSECISSVKGCAHQAQNVFTVLLVRESDRQVAG